MKGKLVEASAGLRGVDPQHRESSGKEHGT